MVGAEIENPVYKVLLIDDDTKFCDLMADYLEPFGFQVESENTGPKGLHRAQTEPFHAVILDVLLPGMDGFEVLRQLRATCHVPVIMLTSRGDETDRIVGLEMGADDYIPKTFSTRELLARLKAVIRRSQLPPMQMTGTPVPTASVMVLGELSINADNHTASINNKPLPLTPLEFALLQLLAKARGRVLTRDTLQQQLQQRDHHVFDRSIDVHVSSLRRKLEDDPRTPTYIKTVRGAGYMFLD